MHIKNYNYDCQNGIIRYTIDIDHDTFDMEHIRTQYGSIQTTDIGDFLCDVDEYDEDEAKLKRAELATKRKQIQELIDQKQGEALASLSLEELQAQLNELK